ncbi:MAG: YceI family protein [Chloroflexota bacterium]
MTTKPIVAPTTTETHGVFKIDPSHSNVEFVAKHMVFASVRGRFSDAEGLLDLNAEDPTRSSVRANVKTASVDTRDTNRDAHLRSADFFDVENYPEITFLSKRVELHGNNEARVVSDLTIRGVTKEVVFDATFLGQGKDPWGNTRVGFSASATVNRKDYGLNWNAALEAGGWLVGDQVKIHLEFEAIRVS